MMKKFCTITAFVIWLFTAAAWAESHKMEYTAAYVNQHWKCAVFEAEMNADAQEAFSSYLLPGDEIICGAEMRYYAQESLDTPLHQDVLMAVRRKGQMLLLSASGSDGKWKTGVESDAFLPAEGGFEVTITPASDGQTVKQLKSGRPYITWVHGNESWQVLVRETGEVHLACYAHQIDAHTRLELETSIPSDTGNLGVTLYTDDESIHYEEFSCVFPTRLTAWTMNGFPKTMEEIRSYATTHQPDVADDEGYIFGVNLRKEPTSQSDSIGQYTAKVKVTGSVPGADAPWYNVQMGDLSGWVSGRYLIEHHDMRLCEWESEVLPVARADRDISLINAGTGAPIMTLPAGTLMHVFHQDGDLLHVIIPRGEWTWKTDWRGIYGMVSANDVSCGISAADLRWK